MKMNKIRKAMVDVKKTSTCLIIVVLTILIVVPLVNAGSDTVDAFIVLANSPPTISPLHSINYTLPKTNDMLYCSNGTYYDINGDPKGGQEWRWKDTGVLIGGETTQYLNLSISGLDKGDNITCESRVNDTINWSSWLASSNSAIIQNTAPIVSNLNLSPDTVYTNQAITCNWTYYDVDSDPQNSSTIRWYVNNVLVKTETYTGSWPTLAPSYFFRGNTVKCSVLGSDGYDNASAYVNSSSITVQNSAPTFTSVSLTPNPALKSQTLTCNVNGRADADGDSMTNYYKFVDTDNVTILKDWSTSFTLNCGLDSACQKGDQIRCIAKVSDGSLNSSEKNTSSSIINSAPQAQTVYIFPYSPDTSLDLDCRHTFYDIDLGDTENATYYKWYLNGTLTGYTSQYLGSGNLTKGDYWKCGVIVNDGTVNSSETISTQVIIDSNNPTDIVISNDGIVDEGESITLTWTWNDPQLPFGTPYTHYVCSSNNITIDGCADQTYCSLTDDTSPTSCSFVPNSTSPTSTAVYVLVIDGTNLTSPIEPSSFTLNHRPTTTNISINVTSSDNFNTYTCLLNGSADSDNDTTHDFYAFYDYQGNTLQSYSGTNTFIVNSGEGTHGDAITCAAKTYDSRIYSEERNTTGHFRAYNLEYSSTRVVNQPMTISINIMNSTTIEGVNISIRNPFNVQFSGLTMAYDNSTGKWEYDFYPNVVGDWEVSNIYAIQDDGQSYIFKGDGDTFAVASSISEQPSQAGGGAGITKIKEITTVTNLSGYCGDGVCGEGENPANCWTDCRVNYDTMITCIWDESIECNWSQTWFPMTLIVMLMSVGIFAVYAYEFRGKKRARA